ncbi:class IIb bacteriocin, lactobin A/cerein 7B family [Bifidobacterium oedipodis]|uniref:class IIb bacteriocin, lactobin A/cerein 7B family n=1 Tax=Bifidobacterium oedipodis TaxID=2675322 RepID=UPI00145D5971|nr:class IIb bacteriocin, lactobin A/cerein 7B family [Bifidobacterium sp. DSM 109957]
MENQTELTVAELETVDGGFVITGSMVALGVGIFAASFAVGVPIGQAFFGK